MINKTTPARAEKVPVAIDGRIMHRKGNLEVILLTLQPGDTVPLHKNPFDVLFAGISGNARMISGSDPQTIYPGETIFVSKEEDRGWENNGKESCRILVIKILSH